MDIRFEILGPLRVTVDSKQLTITPGRDSTVLAVLLLNTTDVVPVPRLIDAVWAEQPPRNARNQVQGCISRLRKQLAQAGTSSELILTEQAGYRLRVEPTSLDLFQFRQLLVEARTASARGEGADAVRLYRAALALWRGSALADIDSVVVVQAASVLAEGRIQALEECIELALTLGGAGDLVGELTELVLRHPYREALHGFLMLALYRAGRQADALAAYRRVRQLLRDELGTEPNADLQRLHQAILNRDPDLDVRQPTLPAAETESPTPHELPAETSGFTGRVEALATLDRMLPSESELAPGPVVISAIAGTAGVGKTALAVRWGHHMADRFPDGQLYINLRGYASAPPLRPVEALSAFLRSLGTPSERIPTDEEQAAALYRTRLAHRRLLVVLDNAHSAEQVRPLLPGSPGCLVLVTSRDRLTGLVARDGARRLTLDVLTPDEAYALLTRLLGAERIQAEPAAVARLARACGYLPLALRIVAANITDRPGRTIGTQVAELTGGDRFQALQADGDEASSVLAALELSYRSLPAEAARIFRLLGLHPGPEVEPYAIAALADTTVAEARQLADRLQSVHLLQEARPGRFVLHDLIRAYAGRVVAATDAERDRHAAIARLLDHYRHTASVAMDTAHPYEHERRPRVMPSSTPTPTLSHHESAIAWLNTELPNLLAAASYAAGAGWSGHTLHLSAVLHRHLRTSGHFFEAESLHLRALTTARDSDVTAELDALIGLGHVCRMRSRIEDATSHYQQALKIASEVRHRPGEMEALRGLGHLHWMQGRHQQATSHYRQALDIAHHIRHRSGEVDVLTGLGDVHLWQGQHQEAAVNYEQALGIARAIGHRPGELSALRGLGYVHWLQGRHGQAVEHFEQMAELARVTGDRTSESDALSGLGEVYSQQGRYHDAMERYQQALRMDRATGNRIGEINEMVGIGHIHRKQHRHRQAANTYERALDIAQELGSRNWQFEALNGLGRVRHATGEADAALTYHHQALAIATDLNQRSDQARSHDGLAHVYHALSDREQARRHWRHALDILTSLDASHAGDEETSVSAIRAHLTDVES